MGDRTFHIRQVWSSAIAIEIEISDMGSETREKHGETMKKHGETMEKRWRNREKQGRRWRVRKGQKRGVEKVGAGHLLRT